MDFVRTPDERFAELPGYGFAPQLRGGHRRRRPGATLRVHHLDEGPADGEVVLLLHGEPSWSLPLPHDDPGAHRCRAPLHRARPRGVRPLGQADPARATTPTPATSSGSASCSSITSTSTASRWSARTGVACSGCVWWRSTRSGSPGWWRPTPSCPTGDANPGDAFLAWQRFSQEVPEFPTGFIINGGCTSDLAPEVIAAYDAPFPDESYKEGARQFPMLVPTSPDDPGRAGEPRRVEDARDVRQAVPVRVQRRRPDHQGRRSCAARSASPARRASPTRRSRAAVTSSRRTAVPSSRRSWPTFIAANPA